MATPDQQRPRRRADETRYLLPLVLADDLTEGLVVIDRESRIQYANPAMTRIFAYARDELEGEPLTMLMPEEHRAQHRAALETYLATGRRTLPWSDVEFPGLHRDGHRLRLRITFTEFGRRGQRLFAGTIRDLAAAGAPAQERAVLARSYRALFEHDAAAVFRCDPDGRIVAANAALARMTGRDDPSELVGRDMADCYVEDEERESVLEDLRRRRDVHNRELRLRRADGGAQWSLVDAVWIHDSAEDEPGALVGTVVDISDRKRIERELELSEARLQRLFDQELVGMFRSRAGPGGEILECNRAFAELLGYASPAEVEGTPRAAFFPEGEGGEAAVGGDRRGGAGVEDEVPLRRKDGSIVRGLAHVRVLEDPEYGEVVEGAVFDVTDRVRAREALERAKEKFQEVFDAAPAWVATMRGEDHVFEMANPAYYDLVGDRDVVGRPVRHVFPDLEGEGYFELLDQVYETGETVRVEERRLPLETDEEEREKYVTFVYQPRHEDGEVVGVFAHGVDVTEEVESRREVEEAERKWATAVELAPVGIAIGPVGGGHLFTVNRAAASILGYRPDEIAGSSIRDVETWVDPSERGSIVERLRDEGTVRDEDVRLRHRSGEVRTVRVSARALELGGEDRILWTLQDVTEEKRREEALRRSEARHRTLVETMAEATLIVDPDGRITFANEEAEELLGLDPSDVDRRAYAEPDWTTTVPDRGPFPGERLPFRRVLETLRPVRDAEHAIERPDGTRRILSVNAAPLSGEGDRVEGVVITIRDVTERKRMEGELRHRALHDDLTGLPNRALFWDRLNHALERSRRTGERMAVLFLDLDGFKRINDEHGHGAGDDALREVADRLRTAVRDADTLARLGGDEFSVLLEDLESPSEADEVASRLTDRFSSPFSVAGENALIRVSCGIALAGPDVTSEAVTPDELVRRAERAMYAAKEEPGSTSRRFGPEIAAERSGRLRREIELKEALDAGDVVAHYQPLVDLTDGSIVGAEALARWEHPERGLIAPGAFIPLAEETGLIVDLGRQVVRTACERLAAWRDEGLLPPDFRLHVNLSAREIDRPDVVDVLDAVFREVGLDAERVAFEVTESVAIETSAVLGRIRALGAPIAVDDFGTGYATLKRLASLEFDNLKLDRLFVDRIGASDRHEAVLEASLTLAEAMGLCPVAEGVETEEQRAWLLEHGCRFAQGFLFARAAPGEELAAWLRSGEALPRD